MKNLKIYLSALVFEFLLISLAFIGMKNVTYAGEVCSHQHVTTINYSQAQTLSDGTTVDGYTGDTYCQDCQQVIATGKVIKAVSSISFSQEGYDYTGKALSPDFTLLDSDGNQVETSSYSCTLSDNTKIGRATASVTLTGDYSGNVTGYFIIRPKGTSIKSISAKRKGFKLTWKQQKKQISGYEIEYSRNENFEDSTSVKVKANKTKKTISGLKAKKVYYVRIRTYKTVNGADYYSAWSKASSVTTCKYLIAIDPGHQKKGNSGTEPVGPGSSTKKAKVAGGATGVSTGLHEYELTLIMAKKLKSILEDRGYEVLLVRTTNDVNITNVERAKKANAAKADIFLRIHANSIASSSVTGAQTICMTSHNPYNSSLYKKSKKLSKCVLNSYISATGLRKEGVMERDDLSGTNWSKVPVTLIELGYMSNSAEDKKMASSSFQKKMATGIADGIDEYFAD